MLQSVCSCLLSQPLDQGALTQPEHYRTDPIATVFPMIGDAPAPYGCHGAESSATSYFKSCGCIPTPAHSAAG